MTAPVLSARMAAVLRAVGGGVTLWQDHDYAWYLCHVGPPTARAATATTWALISRGLLQRIGQHAELTDNGRAWLDAHPLPDQPPTPAGDEGSQPRPKPQGRVTT